MSDPTVSSLLQAIFSTFAQYREFATDHASDYERAVTAGMLALAVWLAGWLLKTTTVKSVKFSWGMACGIAAVLLRIGRWFKPAPAIPSELAVTIVDALKEADARVEGPSLVVIGNCKVQIRCGTPSIFIDGRDVTTRLTQEELQTINDEAKRVQARRYEEETQDLADSLVASLRHAAVPPAERAGAAVPCLNRAKVDDLLGHGVS